jgi:hypothetical protein
VLARGKVEHILDRKVLSDEDLTASSSTPTPQILREVWSLGKVLELWISRQRAYFEDASALSLGTSTMLDYSAGFSLVCTAGYRVFDQDGIDEMAFLTFEHPRFLVATSGGDPD